MAKAEQNRSKPIILSVVGLVVLVAIIYAVRVFGHSAVEVRVAHVSHQDLLSTVSTNGKVEPVDGAAFQAHAPGPGIVAKVYVDVNQKVQPGTLLVSLRDADAKARLSRCAIQPRCRGSRTRRHPGRRLTPKNSSASSRTSLQPSWNETTPPQTSPPCRPCRPRAQPPPLKSRRSSSASRTLPPPWPTRSRISAARYSPRDIANSNARVADAKAAIAAAQSGLSAIDIRSPIAGTVYSIPISPYDFVRDGDDLMDVADLNRIQMRAYFDEPEIGKLTPGQPVKIVWDAKRDQTWHGHISRAPTTVIPYGTRSVGEALISVDDAKGDLPPNSNVTVTVTTSARNNVLSVPREALHTEGVSDFVYRIVNGHLERTPVQAGILSSTDVEILSGLKDGDDVVLNATAPGQDLTDGLAVRRAP